MFRFAIKVVVSALVIASVSELGRRSPTIASVLASLPLTSVLAFVWLYADTNDSAAIATLSSEIVFLVLPSLVLFVALPLLIARGLSFPLSLTLSCALTVLAYFAMLAVMAKMRS